MRPPVSSGTVYIKDPVDVWNHEHTIGNAELAARLGSPMTFDRRGTMFWYDDFENAPLKWGTSIPVDGSITLSNEHPLHGSGCMKIVPPTVAGNSALAYRFVGGIATGRIGAEVNIVMYDSIDVKPTVAFYAYTGTRLIRAGIRLQQTGAGGLSYLHDSDPTIDASYTTFDDTFTIATDTTYSLKFVIDLDNEKYARCIFAGTEIDMSAYSPHAAASGDAQKLHPYIFVISNGSTTPLTYIDNYIITIEEPA